MNQKLILEIKPSHEHLYKNSIIDQKQNCVWVINVVPNSRTVKRVFLNKIILVYAP